MLRNPRWWEDKRVGFYLTARIWIAYWAVESSDLPPAGLLGHLILAEFKYTFAKSDDKI